MIFHLALRMKFRFQVIMAVARIEQKGFELFFVRTKHFPEYGIVDKRFAITLVVEPDAPLFKFEQTDRYGRNKGAHDPFHGMNGNAPDAEKTEYMIDAKRVEIIAHLDKALMSPFKTIGGHSF